MDSCSLIVFAAEGGFDADEAVGGDLAEPLHVPADGVPEITAFRARLRGDQVEGQGAVAGADDVFA